MAVQGEIVERNKGGRPLLFKTPQAMQQAIDEYFAYCDNRTREVFVEKLGETIVISNPAPYTMVGLARALGMDRRTLLDYAKRDKFLLTIKDARLKVEEFNENQLHEGRNAAGVIFNLKNNFGWVDESKVENSGEMTHKYEQLDDKDIDARLNKVIESGQDTTA
jgi:hypothetical protein